MKLNKFLTVFSALCVANALGLSADPAFATDAVFKVKAAQIKKVEYRPYSCFGCLPPHSDLSTKISVTIAPESAIQFSPAAGSSGDYTLIFDTSSPCVDLVHQVNNKGQLRTLTVDFSNDDNFNNGSRTLDLTNASLTAHQTFLYCTLSR